ncbi:leucine-rich repeat-containing protein 49 [Drosophila virilis]|uniref:leucine-rich repeat-containing protein 49 n=1 Tax=Drosophila virilis TaxID=7244 RepID=UPI00017D60FE|nr:leucine-rich repeat-containing protein 49 [Drosophila virilis]XP_032291511.1 leucine-rich repeat-containing protein 49 [Drosophila virilis]
MAKCPGRSMLNDEPPEPQQPQSQVQPQPQQNYLPQTSLLKIEPFVPSFNQRLRRRPIGRSHSTLSHHVIQKRIPVAVQPPTELLVGQQQQQQQPQQLRRSYAPAQHRLQRGTVTRQRSKSTSSSAASTSCRPATSAAASSGTTVGAVVAAATPHTLVGSTGGTLVSGAIVTPQPNGICRIQRLAKEREELPDRINYDRRGLTAIPIFEQEPNLRLLSLQHNLINTFHIPKELPVVQPAPQPQPTPRDQSQQSNQSVCSKGAPEPRSGLRGHATYSRLTRTMSHVSNGRLSSPNSGSPCSGSPLTAQAVAINGGAAYRSKLTKRGFNYAQAQLTPPPALRLRHGLEKSKSFVSNSLQQQLMQRRQLLRRAQGGGLPLAGAARTSELQLQQSCDESSVQSLGGPGGGAGEEEEPHSLASSSSQLEQLSIKNKQLSLSACYGNIFHQLVFLDLYDNQIERIANLDGLPSLSVLLLGKNRITDIGGLAALKATLRVLDLHGNKLTSLGSRISCLHQLKSLNLAGNQIRQINQQDFHGLRCLRELNLKRNKLRRINGFQHLLALERLWLCHNELHRVDDMASIARAVRLLEVTIENNPVSLAGDCVSFLVSHLPLLQSLSQMPITEQVRRAALAWRQHKEQALATHGSRREEVISNARTNWELLRSQQTLGRPKGKLTSELAKINESNEAAVAEEPEQPRDELAELQALFKLPLIAQQKPKLEGEDASSTASSLGPNVDSCSSCYSTDNEEASRQLKLSQPQIDENCNKLSTAPPAPPPPPPAPLPSTSSTPPALTLTPPATGTPVPAATPTPTPPPSTVTLPLPAPAATPTNSTCPGSGNSKQRLRQTTPIAQLGLQMNRGNTPGCKRYMTGSLVRSQTISSSSASNSSSSNSAGRAKQSHNNVANVVSLMPPQSKAAAPGAAPPASPATSTPMTVSKPSAAEREREQGGDYLIEICGRYLNIYGQGALRFIDKQWNPAKANDVHTLNFSYINFNSIVCMLGRIKIRFPHAEHFVFRETNIMSLGQLNALAELQGLSSLLIDAEGNAITGKPDWRAYAIYRLSHWGLKQLNGQDVSEEETEQANAMYTGLSNLVLWSMPEGMLQPLLARLRLDESCTASKLSPKEWLLRPENKSLRLVVGKEALQWKKTTTTTTGVEGGHTAMAPSARDRGRQHFALLLENTCNAVEKLHKLETLWPSMLLDIVRNTLLDYAQLDVYLRNLMAELMK